MKETKKVFEEEKYLKYKNPDPRCHYPFSPQPFGYCLSYRKDVDDGSPKAGTFQECEGCPYWWEEGKASGMKVFADARKIMRETLRRDGGLYLGYQANIAMLLHDEQQGNGEPIDFRDKDNRDTIARKILDLIFG